MEDEIGDLIFSVVNLARQLKIDPEAALRRTNKKFTRRFYEIEKAAKAQNIQLSDMPLAEKDRIWEAAKEKNLNKSGIGSKAPGARDLRVSPR